MFKVFSSIFIFFFLLNCNKEKVDPEISTLKNDVISKSKYSDFIKIIGRKNNSEKVKYFFTYINYDVPYYWKGTPWSFNGTSSEPQKESVACGYFVTNVLKNYGFNIKANYLAQQASSVMIKELCTDVKHFSKVSDVEKYILSKDKNQVYIVGLDFHTGFITRENKDTYFIHSNYIKNQGPVKEKTKESKALNYSKSFMIGQIKFK